MTYDCMTADELAGWLEAAARVRRGAVRPCADCPAAFAAAMQAEGLCCARPTPGGGRLPNDGRGRLYGRTMMSATGPELSVPTLRPGSLHS